MKFGAGTGENPFAKVKGSIAELISRLQGETSSQALDVEISTLQLQLHMDTMRADNGQICEKNQGESVSPDDDCCWENGPRDCRAKRCAKHRSESISFIDDLNSFDSKGLPYQDCEVPSHVGKQKAAACISSTHQDEQKYKKRERRERKAR